MKILSIDPGNIYSAYCIIEKETLSVIEFGKVDNETMRAVMKNAEYDEAAIERIASYGMGVGKTVFETCEWIGRFTELSKVPVHYVYRIEEKEHICKDSRAKDANIRRALIDRFAKHDFRSGRGTKKNPDFFYGFKADCWQAFAVGITYIEGKQSGRNKD